MTLEIIPVARKRAYPPRVSQFTEPFWSGLAQGRWQSTCCEACGKFTFPPKPICPHCWSDRMQWKDLSKRGTLYSWTRVHAAPRVFTDESPYALCVVDLDIGLRIATRMVEREGVAFQNGMPMELVVLRFEDGPLFASRPV
ncbi:MAG: OB-fold domain-containing protein [Variovorax sp.]|nr:OB-fold domain-containing protein [Variovorax sp.]